MRNRLKYKEMYGNTERAHSNGELLQGISAFVKSLRLTVAVVSSVLMWRKTLNFNAMNVFCLAADSLYCITFWSSIVFGWITF